MGRRSENVRTCTRCPTPSPAGRRATRTWHPSPRSSKHTVYAFEDDFCRLARTRLLSSAFASSGSFTPVGLGLTVTCSTFTYLESLSSHSLAYTTAGVLLLVGGYGVHGDRDGTNGAVSLLARGDRGAWERVTTSWPTRYRLGGGCSGARAPCGAYYLTGCACSRPVRHGVAQCMSAARKGHGLWQQTFDCSFLSH